MKKTLLITTILLVVCLLSACNPFGGIGAITTPGGTTTPPGGTTTAHPADPSLPVLSELTEALEAASPTRARITITSRHEAHGGDLKTSCYLLHTEEGAYYYYEAERFLPLSEALAADTATEKVTGHLLLRGDSIIASSAEIDDALLEELTHYSIRTPSLRASFFKSYNVYREGDCVILAGVADDADLMFDDHLAALRNLALTITFRASDLTPIAFAIEATTAEGIPLRYEAGYSYEPTTLPTSAAAKTPDLSLWE